MIAIIGRNSNLHGTLTYNNLKVEKEKGQILFTNKIIETPSGQYSVTQLAQSFTPYLIANRNTEKHTLHISLNPDPKDIVDDEKLKELAKEYMQEMSYGEQPYVVFKHTDIQRIHIHIVSVCVDEEGKKISDKFEKTKSMKICRELEHKHNLIAATEKSYQQNNQIFQPVDYKKGDIKSQLASVIRRLPNQYYFQTLGEYNALLSCYNITCEKVEGEIQGKSQKGLLYSTLNEKLKKVGLPLKASLFGKKSGLPALENHFEKSKNKLKNHPTKLTLQSIITDSLQSTKDELAFKKLLSKQNIDVFVRKNNEERIYGITFIDHKSKTVWNGSRLGKEFSANTFNNYWNHNIKPEFIELDKQQSKLSMSNLSDLPTQEPHQIFDFLNKTEKIESNLFNILSELIPKTKEENFYEQENFNRIKKKRKRRKP